MTSLIFRAAQGLDAARGVDFLGRHLRALDDAAAVGGIGSRQAIDDRDLDFLRLRAGAPAATVRPAETGKRELIGVLNVRLTAFSFVDWKCVVLKSVLADVNRETPPGEVLGNGCDTHASGAEILSSRNSVCGWPWSVIRPRVEHIGPVA